MIVPELTVEQLRAATSLADRLYVRAGPGSGKTFTAAEAFGFLRYVRYVDDPRGVIGVTFARSARRELESRVATRWGRRAVCTPNGVHTFDDLHRRLIRYLVAEGLIDWPGGQPPIRVDDSWSQHDHATRSVGARARCYLTLDLEGRIAIATTRSNTVAPRPCFLDAARYRAALTAGNCTHAEIRSVLSSAVDDTQYPTFNVAIRDCLGAGVCHLIVDEAFDMNLLDVTIVERAIEAGVGVTVVGDPWQSLYEFRGATPERISDLMNRWSFEQRPMSGSRRYKSPEMRGLANRLFNNAWFTVKRARADDTFDVAIAHDWGDLWDYSQRPVLPIGFPNKMAGGWPNSCFVLILDALVRDAFKLDAAAIGEARRRLGAVDFSEQIDATVAALRDPTTSPADVWVTLLNQFGPIVERTWRSPGAVANQCMTRLKQLVTSGVPPILGLSVHQAKGLEWDRVLFLNAELFTDPDIANRLSLDHDNHRAIYVALTRARRRVRVAPITSTQFGVIREPVEWIRLRP